MNNTQIVFGIVTTNNDYEVGIINQSLPQFEYSKLKIDYNMYMHIWKYDRVEWDKELSRIFEDIYEELNEYNISWKFIKLGATLNDVDDISEIYCDSDSILEEVLYIKREIGIDTSII